MGKHRLECPADPHVFFNDECRQPKTISTRTVDVSLVGFGELKEMMPHYLRCVRDPLKECQILSLSQAGIAQAALLN